MKITAAGDTVWTKEIYFSTNSEGSSVQQLNDEGFLVCGKVDGVSYSVDKITIIRLSSSGDQRCLQQILLKLPEKV